MKTRDLIKLLELHGYQLIRSNGHLIYSNGRNSVAIQHGKEHSRGLVRRVLQQAQLDKKVIQGVLR